MAGTPVGDTGAQNVPGQPTPSSASRRVLAQKALNLAAKTPLPDQFGEMVAPSPKPASKTAPSVPVVKRSRGGCGLMLMFLLSSAFTATICMYTYRIKWDPVLEAGKRDIQAGFKEYSRQAQALGEMDYSDFLATKEKVTVEAKALYSEYSQKAADLFASSGSGAGSRSMDSTCQAVINGFEITFLAPSRTFSAAHEVHGKALTKMLMDLSNVHQRFKSVTHLVEYPQDQESLPTAKNTMTTLGCEGTLEGQCMIVDFESLGEEEDQGAALQALVAPQLKDSPSSLFFIANIEYLEPSGAAVLLALIGEHGVLNQPGCDISSQSSAALIFVPVETDSEPDIFETLEDFESTIANNLAVVVSEADSEGSVQIDDEVMKEAETTAAALRRRVSENVLRAKPIGASTTTGNAEADARLSEKAAGVRAVYKPSAEEVAEAQQLRQEAQESADAKEL